LTEAKAKIIELEKQIASYRAKDEFVQHMGASFRKNASGEYVAAVYCPTVLNRLGLDFLIFRFNVALVAGILLLTVEIFNM
ncbi:MAG TPA: hypothetical protein ACHBY7_03430, partial [Arsenophonus sp.]